MMKCSTHQARGAQASAVVPRQPRVQRHVVIGRLSSCTSPREQQQQRLSAAPWAIHSSQTEGSSTVTTEPASPAAPKVPEVVLTLKKPVGLVFAQAPSGGPVYVEEVVAGGLADKTGKVQKGDILARCSAIILKSGTEGQYAEEGYGQVPYNNFQKVDFDCAGQDFKTVMAALKSNNSRWGIMDVTMVFQKPTA